MAKRRQSRLTGRSIGRKTVKVTSDKQPTRYSDVLAKWAKEKDPTSINEALGPSRANWFRRKLPEKRRSAADPSGDVDRQARRAEMDPNRKTQCKIL